MGLFDFDTLVNRRNTASLKWDRYNGKDIIPLWVADMDFRSPPGVLAALHRRIEHGVFGYTHAPEELTTAVIRRLDRLYGWLIERQWLVWLPGLVSGLNVACRATGRDGDKVLTVVPIYPPFLSAPRLSRRGLVTVGLVDDGYRWELDLAHLENAVTASTRLFLFCNPHNPTGRVHGRAELENLVAFCQEHDLVICSDEIHCDLVLDQDKNHIPTASINAEAQARTITLMAPSKTFNLPGLGCSFAIIADETLRRNFKNAMAGIVPEVNALGYTATLAAYLEGHDWHRCLLDYLRGNRDLVEKTVAALPGLAMRHVEATYLAWIDASAAKLADPTAFFEAAGVGLFDGRDFGAPGFLRLNFGCPRSLLQKALKRMRDHTSRCQINSPSL